MSAQSLPHRHRITVQEFGQMGSAGIFRDIERVELIDGEIFDMAPIGSFHAGIVTRLSRALNQAVGDQALVWTQNPVRLSNQSEPLPDLALLIPRDDDYIRSLPEPKDILLLIEVADSSLDYDRNTKLPLYARHGIPEVWLFDLKGLRVEVYREPNAETFQATLALGPSDRLDLPGLSGRGIDLAKVLTVDTDR